MSGADQGGAGRREVAYRLFAAEYDDADFSYSESDEERAPNYVVTPTGARVNRLFAVGVLTEVEQVNDEVLRARVVDPTGAFVVYAGQYQPDEMAFLERAEPPTFVSVTGKARTFQPEDSETVYTSVRPESINEVDAETRDRWTVTTAERTLDRIATVAGALAREERGDDLRAVLEADGVDEGLAAGIPMALEHYGTTPTYLQALRDVALDAARVVAGERDEVRSLTADPAATGDATLSDLTDLDAIEQSSTTTDAATDPVETETAATETTATTGTADAADTETSASSPEPATSDEPTSTDSVEATTGTATADTATSTTTETTETDEVSTETATDTEPVSTDTSDSTDTAASSDSTETAPTADTTSTDTATTGSAAADTVTDSTAEDAAEDEDIGDFEPGEFEIEDDERERIEDEFGTDFSTGTEVDDPGEADIETPDPEEMAEAEADADTEPVEAETDATLDTEPAEEPADDAGEAESEPADTAADAGEATADDGADEPAEDVDVSEAVMDVMRDLDDGDGADRETLVETVVDDYGADPDAVEDAIQDALMGGQCYEPGDSTLKPI